MTIRDLIEQGIKIQGRYEIHKINDDNNTEVLSKGDNFEFDMSANEQFWDMEVNYVFPLLEALTPWRGNPIYSAYIVIEVKDREY